jgi:hypothetical protein
MCVHIQLLKTGKKFITLLQRKNKMATNKYAEFTAIVKAMEADFEKFYDKEVGAAGARVRKACQDLVKLCKDTRNDVTAVKAERKPPKE